MQIDVTALDDISPRARSLALNSPESTVRSMRRKAAGL